MLVSAFRLDRENDRGPDAQLGEDFVDRKSTRLNGVQDGITNELLGSPSNRP